MWLLCYSLECGKIWDHIQTSRFPPRATIIHELVALATLHKREWKSGMPLPDWETRWQISLPLPSSFLFHLHLFLTCKNTRAPAVPSCHVLHLLAPPNEAPRLKTACLIQLVFNSVKVPDGPVIPGPVRHVCPHKPTCIDTWTRHSHGCGGPCLVKCNENARSRLHDQLLHDFYVSKAMLVSTYREEERPWLWRQEHLSSVSHLTL